MDRHVHIDFPSVQANEAWNLWIKYETKPVSQISFWSKVENVMKEEIVSTGSTKLQASSSQKIHRQFEFWVNFGCEREIAAILAAFSLFRMAGYVESGMPCAPRICKLKFENNVWNWRSPLLPHPRNWAKPKQTWQARALQAWATFALLLLLISTSFRPTKTTLALNLTFNLSKAVGFWDHCFSFWI